MKLQLAQLLALLANFAFGNHEQPHRLLRTAVASNTESNASVELKTRNVAVDISSTALIKNYAIEKKNEITQGAEQGGTIAEEQNQNEGANLFGHRSLSPSSSSRRMKGKTTTTIAGSKKSSKSSKSDAPKDPITLSLLDIPGVCPEAESLFIACSSGTSRNNTWINCFDIRDFGASPPFFLQSVNFWIANAVENTLEVVVFEGTENATSGVSATVLHWESIPNPFTNGNSTHILTSPIEVTTDTVCVGIFSPDGANAGVRTAIADEPGTGTESYVLAPDCGLDDPTPVGTFDFKVDFCIEADVVPSG